MLEWAPGSVPAPAGGRRLRLEALGLEFFQAVGKRLIELEVGHGLGVCEIERRGLVQEEVTLGRTARG